MGQGGGVSFHTAPQDVVVQDKERKRDGRTEGGLLSNFSTAVGPFHSASAPVFKASPSARPRPPHSQNAQKLNKWLTT